MYSAVLPAAHIRRLLASSIMNRNSVIIRLHYSAGDLVALACG
jgi:hypothetical protein